MNETLISFAGTSILILSVVLGVASRLRANPQALGPIGRRTLIALAGWVDVVRAMRRARTDPAWTESHQRAFGRHAGAWLVTLALLAGPASIGVRITFGYLHSLVTRSFNPFFGIDWFFYDMCLMLGSAAGVASYLLVPAVRRGIQAAREEVGPNRLSHDSSMAPAFLTILCASVAGWTADVIANAVIWGVPPTASLASVLETILRYTAAGVVILIVGASPMTNGQRFGRLMGAYGAWWGSRFVSGIVFWFLGSAWRGIRLPFVQITMGELYPLGWALVYVWVISALWVRTKTSRAETSPAA